MKNVINFLQKNNIKYVLHEHSAVYTCAEAAKHCGNVLGLSCKNLFLKNKKGKRFFLVVLPANKQTDLKKFTEIVDEKKMSFTNHEALKEKLGLEAGSVSPFGLINDKNNEVEIWIDNDVYNSEMVSFHPNINTASLDLTKEMFHKFLDSIEHKINVFNL